MLFGLFSKKDHRHYLTRAGKHLAAERYADARIDFEEALKLCPAEAAQDAQEIRSGLDAAHNGLATLNLHEGERSVNAGDVEKAADHFTLACELAFDETIKAMAREQLKKLKQPQQAAVAAAGPYAAYAASASTAPAQGGSRINVSEGSKGSERHAHASHGGGCGSSCGTGSQRMDVVGDTGAEHLSEDDQFELLIHPLPGDLPGRYAAAGEKFKKAYLLIHDGNDAKAFPILQEMLVSGENDIVIYELALIMYRSRRVHECESLLKRSLAINPGNQLSYVALVHLLAETRRFPEALATVERMIELGVAADQALYMQGELHLASGDEAKALECWSRSLNNPGTARAAAEQLIPILNAQGRQQDAKFLAKKYLKGCC